MLKYYFSFTFCLFFLNISYSKVADIHVRSPEEDKFVEDRQKEKDNNRAQERLNDPNSSYEKKVEALGTLVENGKIA